MMNHPIYRKEMMPIIKLALRWLVLLGVRLMISKKTMGPRLSGEEIVDPWTKSGGLFLFRLRVGRTRSFQAFFYEKAYSLRTRRNRLLGSPVIINPFKEFIVGEECNNVFFRRHGTL